MVKNGSLGILKVMGSTVGVTNTIMAKCFTVSNHLVDSDKLLLLSSYGHCSWER